MASIEHAPSLNGTHTDDASADTLDDVENVATDVATEDAGAIDESATAEAIEIADVAEGAGEVDGVEAAASEPESTTEPDFLSELAVAMRGVAAQERERLSGRAAEDASSHIDDARSRGTTTADSLRQVADDDVAGVESWAEAEIERIRGEAAERLETRRSELEAELERHETVVEGEVQAVESALVEYDTSLSTFMDELDAVTDPAEIARRASHLPARPDLARVREDARAAALATIAAESPAPTADDDGSPDSGDADRSVAEAAVAIDASIETLGSDEAAKAESEVLTESAFVSEDLDGSAEAIEDPTDLAADARSDVPTPIGVMAPEAYDETDLGTGTEDQPWEMPGLASLASDARLEPTATASFSNKTAVRLLRTVAPWTAPSSHDKAPDDQG